YFLTSPATGSHTLTVTAASSADIKVVSASYSGASLSQPDSVITRWDPSGSAMSTTSLTATTDNSWAMLVGATVWPPTWNAGGTVRVGGLSGSSNPGSALGIADSGPLHTPNTTASITIPGGGAGAEFGTIMASYKPSTGLPLLNQSSLTYLGGFRVPESCGDPADEADTMYYGG